MSYCLIKLLKGVSKIQTIQCRHRKCVKINLLVIHKESICRSAFNDKTQSFWEAAFTENHTNHHYEALGPKVN